LLDKWIDTQTDRQLDGWTNRWADGRRMDGQLGTQTDGLTDGRMVRWTVR
jgi:hypothetical protein